THAAPLAWMPLVLFCCERLLRAPDLRRAAALAVVLAITLLPGMPQTVFFTYQLLALRILFELVSRPGARPAGLALALLVALGAPPLLAAAQLVPEIEVASRSLRSGALSVTELAPWGRWDSGYFRAALVTHGK